MLILSLLVVLAWQTDTCHAEEYLFLVGVKDYSQKGELTDLKYAEEDVHTLAQLFSDAGVPSTNIVLMTQRVAANKARFAPSAEQIRNELDLLLKILKPEDSIIVGFSGHGLQFKNDDTNYYCPIDAKPDTNNKHTLVSLTDVYLKLEKCKANTKLLLVDACRNDPLSSTAKAARRIQIQPVFARPAPVFSGGTIAIFSCSESEQSFEHPDLKSGLFFHFVNRALAGEADADDDNVVDLGELENFATKNVQKWAQANLGKSQTPESRGTKRGTIEIVRFDRKVVPKFPPLETMAEMDRNSPSIPFPKPKATGKTLTNSIGMKLTIIPKGTFLMGAPPDEEGSDDSERQHVVTISKDLYLGMYEVTQAEYQKVMGINPSEFQGDKIAERHPKTGRVIKAVDSSNYPVENVSWLDAVEFCKKLSDLPEERAAKRVYRLPTEAEWEHACRAGSMTAFSFGDDRSELSEYAWFSSSSTHPVVQKKPNAWGLYDMHGNVWEWCSDWYGDYPASDALDPAGAALGKYRVIRGGGWYNNTNLVTDCRSAYRGRWEISSRVNRHGFRVALSSAEIPKSPEVGNRASDLIGSSIVSPVLMENPAKMAALLNDSNPLFQKIFGNNRFDSLPSGVVFSDLVEGNSRVIAGRKSVVTVEYKCYFASNMQQLPPESLGAVRFTLAVEDVRPIGLQDGLMGIGVGGTRRVFVPSKIAFGSDGSKDVRGGRLVPPNTDLVWDLDVVHIKNPMP